MLNVFSLDTHATVILRQGGGPHLRQRAARAGTLAVLCNSRVEATGEDSNVHGGTPDLLREWPNTQSATHARCAQNPKNTEAAARQCH